MIKYFQTVWKNKPKLINWFHFGFWVIPTDLSTVLLGKYIEGPKRHFISFFDTTNTNVFPRAIAFTPTPNGSMSMIMIMDN